MFKKIFFITALFFTSLNVFAKNLTFEGLSKFNLDDIQSITSIDIFKNNLDVNSVNVILKELSLSELIYEVSFTEVDDKFIFKVTEGNIIENIFINNNVWIRDDLILENLVSKKDTFLTKNKIKNDINIISNIYKTKGFQNISVSAKVEKYSIDRVNIIYEVDENKQQKINVIKFIGNNFFSNSFLNTLINSQSIKFYNIFKSGSNLNYSTFEFDKNQIISAYIDEGFNNVKVSYVLEKTSLNNNVLFFYIDEGERIKIDNYEFNFKDNNVSKLLDDLTVDFSNKLKKNNNFYSKI